MVRSLGSLLVLVVMLLASASSGPLPVAAQDATPAAMEECPTTTPEENEAIVGQFYDAIASGDDATLATVLAPDHVYHGPVGEPSDEPGSEDTAAWASERREDIAGMTVIADPVMSEGDQVMAYLTWGGTNPDTGDPIELIGVGLFRIECGKIAENWAVADTLDRLMALGVITEEELASVTAETEATPAP